VLISEITGKRKLKIKQQEIFLYKRLKREQSTMLTAIKEIAHIKDHKLTMQIPEDFHYEKVEVLILPFIDSPKKQLGKNNLLKKFRELQKEADKFHCDIDPQVDIARLTEDINDAVL